MPQADREPHLDPTPGPAPIRIRPCPLCGVDNEHRAPSRFSLAPWILKGCTGCGFLYLENAPDYGALSETLAWDKAFQQETERRLAARPRAKRAIRRARALLLPRRRDMDHYADRLFPPGNILDIGCGEGSQLLKLGDGFTPFGIEIGKDAAARADGRLAPLGGRVVHASALEGLAAFETDFFSGAILRSFLEHETAPGPVLDSLRRVMAPDGAALVKVPNFASLNRRVMGRRWCGFRYPDHVNYFTPASLTRLTRESGFHCRFIWSKSLPVSDNMTAVLRPAG